MTAIPRLYRSATPMRDCATLAGTDREFMRFLASRRAASLVPPASAHPSHTRVAEARAGKGSH